MHHPLVPFFIFLTIFILCIVTISYSFSNECDNHPHSSACEEENSYIALSVLGTFLVLMCICGCIGHCLRDNASEDERVPLVGHPPPPHHHHPHHQHYPSPPPPHHTTATYPEPVEATRMEEPSAPSSDDKA